MVCMGVKILIIVKEFKASSKIRQNGMDVIVSQNLYKQPFFLIFDMI